MTHGTLQSAFMGSLLSASYNQTEISESALKRGARTRSENQRTLTEHLALQRFELTFHLKKSDQWQITRYSLTKYSIHYFFSFRTMVMSRTQLICCFLTPLWSLVFRSTTSWLEEASRTSGSCSSALDTRTRLENSTPCSTGQKNLYNILTTGCDAISFVL